MTEDKVNIACRDWLVSKGYKYKGILNVGLGQVPVPLSGSRSILIDHQGVKDNPIDLIWVEAKGSDCNLSKLLEGFIRLCAGVYYGGGNGYLAVPHAEYDRLIDHKDFLEAVAQSVNGKGMTGLLDMEEGNEIIL